MLNTLTGIKQAAFYTSTSLGFGGVGYLLTKAVTLIKPSMNAYISPQIGFLAPAVMVGTMLADGYMHNEDYYIMRKHTDAILGLSLAAAAFAPLAMGAALRIPFKATLITTALTQVPILMYVGFAISQCGRDPGI